MATENTELTALLQGKSVSGTSDSNGKKTVTFDDGSVLTVAVEESGTNTASTGGSIKKVSQDGSTLSLEFEGGSTIDFLLANAKGSIEVRDTNDKSVYSN